MPFMKKFFIPGLFLIAVSSFAKPSDGRHEFHIFVTNDVHGCYFDSLYVGQKTRPSLLAVSSAVNDARKEYGAENVILIDGGDGVQGDNASYYFNYVDTLSEHIFFRMAAYMKYDALIVGNHDVETGHQCYDRFRRRTVIPYLAANALKPDGNPYFDSYTLLERGGLRILVVGFTNANIRSWLSPKLWEGMDFERLADCARKTVDRLRSTLKPDAVIVATHTGTGHGDGREAENEGLDLFNTLDGVDLLICSHDHRPYTVSRDGFSLMDAGSHCRNLGHAVLSLEVKKGRVVARNTSAELLEVDKTSTDSDMRKLFARDYAKVREFTQTKVGRLAMPLVTRDSYRGMSDYLNLIHTVCLGCTPAQISIAAPLNFNGYVKAGTVIFNDLFSIYPYENQLYVVRMTGEQVRGYLEYSYDGWINTYRDGGHLLKIEQRKDPRTDTERWSFKGAMFNFDSAGGINYTVDVAKEYGSRVNITAMADGTPFNPKAVYYVAMTSYRASGGGGLLKGGAGIDTDRIDELVVEKYPEIRELIKDYIESFDCVTPELVGNPQVIGHWNFIPEDVAATALDADMKLVFPQKR